MFVTNAQLFRAAHRVAIADGFVHGWPSCASAVHPDGTVWGTYRLPAAPWLHVRDVPRSQLQTQPDADSDQIGTTEWAVNRWANANGFLAGMPTYEQAWDGQQEVLGVVLFDHGAPIDFKNVPENELLGASPLKANGECVYPRNTWSSVNLWAFHHGYPAGFPDFEVGTNVYGTFMVQASSGVQFHDVLETDLLAALDLPHTPLPVSASLARSWNDKGLWTGQAAQTDVHDPGQLDHLVNGLIFSASEAWQILDVKLTHVDSDTTAVVARDVPTHQFDGVPARGTWQARVDGQQLTNDACELLITVR